MATPSPTPSPAPAPSPSSPKLVSPITTVSVVTAAAATNDAVSASTAKKPQPIPWTHQETVNLIRAYQEKWYAVKRGPLRSNQWEEVAVVVAARCGYDFAHPSSKSAVQCRHKMEKLRQRHRAVKKQRLLGGAAVGGRSGGGFAVWQYSGLMDELERGGPLPISAQPIASMAPPPPNGDYDYDVPGENDEDFDEEEGYERENYSRSKNVNYILNQSPSMDKYRRILREHVGKGTWRADGGDDHGDDDDDDDDDDDNGGYREKKRVVVNERVLVSGLTREMRAFADRFIGMENLKMEMIKETERCRLEMENRRIEMILESRRRTIEYIGRAFGSSKRSKTSEET